MPNRNMWVEGIGNEVIYAFVAFLGSLIPMIVMVVRRSNIQETIHPASEENVQAAREEVTHLREAQIQTDTTFESQQQQPIQENHGQHDCPICLATTQYAVQTNCGHLFCGRCMILYWRNGSWLGAVRCPICRQTVTLLLINFTQDEHNSTTEEKREVVDTIYLYNRRFSGAPRPWIDYLRDLPTLLRHMFTDFFSVGGLVFMFRIRIVVVLLAAFLYFISPLDIIPEAVFGLFGFLDDLFVVLLLAIYITMIYRNVVANRATD